MSRLAGPKAQELAVRTYFTLRWGMAGAAFFLPIVLWVGEDLISSAPMPESISAYYHTGMRNVFDGTLIVMAVFLFLYKGFSKHENNFLNAAGVATAGIALFPCAPDRGATEGYASFTWPAGHGIFALIAFGCIGFVAIFLGGDTLDLIDDDRRRRRFQRAYWGLGAAMIVLPVVTTLLSRRGFGDLFWTESAALWLFGAYWLVKTWEFRTADTEVRALGGVLPEPGAARRASMRAGRVSP